MTYSLGSASRMVLGCFCMQLLATDSKSLKKQTKKKDMKLCTELSDQTMQDVVKVLAIIKKRHEIVH